MRRNCKKCDKLRSVVKHPKGIVSFANTIKVYKQIYWQYCNGLAHLLADNEMTNTLLPCSVGRVDVRITDAWIYSEAEKKLWQKASAMSYEWLLLGKPLQQYTKLAAMLMNTPELEIKKLPDILL